MYCVLCACLVSDIHIHTDLAPLDYTTTTNPHYRSGPPSMLYLVREVVVVAQEKRQREALKQKAKEEAQKAKEARKEERERKRKVKELKAMRVDMFAQDYRAEADSRVGFRSYGAALWKKYLSLVDNGS